VDEAPRLGNTLTGHVILKNEPNSPGSCDDSRVEWSERVIERPVREMMLADGRICRWAR